MVKPIVARPRRRVQVETMVDLGRRERRTRGGRAGGRCFVDWDNRCCVLVVCGLESVEWSEW